MYLFVYLLWMYLVEYKVSQYLHMGNDLHLVKLSWGISQRARSELSMPTCTPNSWSTVKITCHWLTESELFSSKTTLLERPEINFRNMKGSNWRQIAFTPDQRTDRKLASDSAIRCSRLWMLDSVCWNFKNKANNLSNIVKLLTHSYIFVPPHMWARKNAYFYEFML